MHGRRSPLLGSLIVVLAASCFGMLGTLSRFVYDLGLEPYGFVAWRAGIGAVVTAGFVAWGLQRGGRLVGWRSLDRRGRASLGIASLAGASLNIAMFLAFQRTPVAIVLLCFYLYPALVAGASALLGWEPMDRPRIAALILALGGMVAVVVGGPDTGAAGGIDPLGVALALSAAVSQCVFVLVSRHGYRAVPTDQAMGTILGVSAAVAGVLALAVGGPAALTLPLTEPPALLGLLVFGGIFGAAVPSFLFLAGIRWIGPVRAGILMLIEPLVGVALAAAFLAEAIGPLQAIGGLAILVAAVIIQRAQPGEPALIPAAEPEPEPEPESGPLPGPTPWPMPGPEGAQGAPPPGGARAPLAEPGQEGGRP
ncbi:MAG: DMT family transporter [Chloroflexota bacterium]|nr:MAG: DMT family transporter [Chloroflexota bacterium]